MKGSVLADSGSTFQGLLNDIFGDDCLVAMGTILGRIGLKVKTQGARPFGFVRLEKAANSRISFRVIISTLLKVLGCLGSSFD